MISLLHHHKKKTLVRKFHFNHIPLSQFWGLNCRVSPSYNHPHPFIGGSTHLNVQNNNNYHVLSNTWSLGDVILFDLSEWIWPHSSTKFKWYYVMGNMSPLVWVNQTEEIEWNFVKWCSLKSSLIKLIGWWVRCFQS